MKKKITIIIIIVAILGIASFFIYKKVKQRKETSSGTGSTGSSSAGFPLKQGSRGTEVKNIQGSLNRILPATLTVDGIFGPATEASLQQKIGLSQLTKKQYDAFMSVMSGFVMGTGLNQFELAQIKNA